MCKETSRIRRSRSRATSSTNSVQVTLQMCVNPRANPRMGRRLWFFKGRRLEVEIVGLNSDAEGVARFEGFTLFVPDTVPGDRARVRVISVQKNYARALLDELLEHSPARIAPPCPLVPR